jgi:hypothetical protein
MVNRGELSNDGLVLLILMVQHLRILEMLNQGIQSLQTRIGQGADLNMRWVTF